MPSTKSAAKSQKRGKKSASFRIGRVRAYLRGRVWYLCYHEHGKRHQPRVGPDRVQARQLAAEINAQLEVGAPSTLGFEPISIVELRQRWLDQHEHVRRSSLNTIRRYRAATQHLINFVTDVRPLRRASDFRPNHAEHFVRYLRSIKVAPNGHKNAGKRRLRDAGVRFILETCSTLFNYAARHRHLPPYVENPFRAIEVSRIPIEDAKPIVVFNEEQEEAFLDTCDAWQFPVFATLLLTGLRPGELIHLLLPEDLNLDDGWLYVRNKPKLGWRVKTRNERDIPLMPELADVLRVMLGGRNIGVVFRQRRCADDHVPPLQCQTRSELEFGLASRATRLEESSPESTTRDSFEAAAKTIWRDLGALKTDWVRKEFMQLTRKIGSAEITAPKTLRHTFATMLQDANVDPLIRNELMGHAPGGSNGGGLGMTAIYTHTRPETKRRQLEHAVRGRPGIEIARRWHSGPRNS